MSGLKSLIKERAGTIAGFARAMDVTPQVINNWMDRGIPGNRLFDAADALGVSADDLRAYTSEADIRRFKLLFARMDRVAQARTLRDLKDIAE